MMITRSPQESPNPFRSPGSRSASEYLQSRQTPGRWVRAGLHGTGDIPSLLGEVSAAMAVDYTSREVFSVCLALHEALVNAIEHGHGRDPQKEVRLTCYVTGRQVVAEIEDQGPGFDPEKFLPRGNAPGCFRGGLILMCQHMTDVRFNRRGNRVVMVKRSGRG